MPIQIIVMFGVIPFLAAVVLPSLISTRIAARILKQKLPSFIYLLPFYATLSAGAILANVFWENSIFNKLYYEWDRIFLPYSFVGGEVPSLIGTASSSWIAQGLSVFHLQLIWFGLTILVYSVAMITSLIFLRNKFKENQIVIYSTVLLIVFSFLCLIIETILL